MTDFGDTSTREGLRHARNLVVKQWSKEKQRVANLERRLEDAQGQLEWLERNASYDLDAYANFIVAQNPRKR